MKMATKTEELELRIKELEQTKKRAMRSDRIAKITLYTVTVLYCVVVTYTGLN